MVDVVAATAADFSTIEDAFHALRPSTAGIVRLSILLNLACGTFESDFVGDKA